MNMQWYCNVALIFTLLVTNKFEHISYVYGPFVYASLSEIHFKFCVLIFKWLNFFLLVCHIFQHIISKEVIFLPFYYPLMHVINLNNFSTFYLLFIIFMHFEYCLKNHI